MLSKPNCHFVFILIVDCSDVSSTRPASEIEALSFRVSQLQSERDQAVEDVAQMKKEFVNLNETHAQVTIDV